MAFDESTAGGQGFADTAWSVVIAAGGDSSPGAKAALAALCRTYWPAIYGFLRRQGYDRSDAQDLTQSFFAHVLENKTLRRASRERGRFRSFLIGALKHCVADEYNRAHALKRGGDFQFVSLQDLEAEELHHQQMARDLTPEELLDARWARLLLDRAIETLRSQLSAKGEAEMFETLTPFLGGEKSGISYQDAAGKLDVTLGAVKTLIHRLRRDFAATVRREVMQTVAAPHEVDNELRALRTVFSRAAERQIA